MHLLRVFHCFCFEMRLPGGVLLFLLSDAFAKTFIVVSALRRICKEFCRCLRFHMHVLRDLLLLMLSYAFAKWFVVVSAIRDNYQLYDGFLVIMGTDTMAYCASALSFMLENLGKTVIVTGSQIPFCKTYSDARRNLLFAMSLACSLDIPEVIRSSTQLLSTISLACSLAIPKVCIIIQRKGQTHDSHCR